MSVSLDHRMIWLWRSRVFLFLSQTASEKFSFLTLMLLPKMETQRKSPTFFSTLKRVFMKLWSSMLCDGSFYCVTFFLSILFIVPSTCNTYGPTDPIELLTGRLQARKKSFCGFCGWHFLCNLCLLKQSFFLLLSVSRAWSLGQIEIIFASRFCCFYVVSLPGFVFLHDGNFAVLC